MVVIEHNLDIIRRADWIIDMGPDGGNRGGEILYSGNLMGLKNAKGRLPVNTSKLLGMKKTPKSLISEFLMNRENKLFFTFHVFH